MEVFLNKHNDVIDEHLSAHAEFETRHLVAQRAQVRGLSGRLQDDLNALLARVLARQRELDGSTRLERDCHPTVVPVERVTVHRLERLKLIFHFANPGSA